MARESIVSPVETELSSHPKSWGFSGSVSTKMVINPSESCCVVAEGVVAGLLSALLDEEPASQPR